jgi:circadian clock protein KaiB
MGKEKDKISDSPRTYHFKLFVAGDEPNSRKAKERLKRFCETRLKGNYKLEVIDVLEDYKSALENNILLAPTLVVGGPKPETKIIGSLDDERKILEVLGISEAEEKG